MPIDAWDTIPLDHLASVWFSGVDKHIELGETIVKLCNYLDVYRNRRLGSEHSFSIGSAKSGEIKRFQLQVGDVLITKDSETPDDIGIPSVVVSDLPNTICGYHLALIRPKAELNSAFLGQYLSGESAKRHFLRLAAGTTRFGLNLEAVCSLGIPNISIEEQAAIAHVLDTIDLAIEHTRIACQTLGIVRRAFLQELMPPWIGFRHIESGPLPAGVESIEIARDVCDVCNGSTPRRSEGRYWRDGTVPWLPTGKVHDRTITKADQFVTESALRECSINLLPAGTVLVGMIGQGRTRGMCAYLGMEACINQNFGAFVPRRKVHGRWLFHYFDFYYSRLREMGGGTNQGALNCFLLKRLRLPLPPLDRQREVSDLLDAFEKVEQSYRLVIREREQLKKAIMADLLSGTVRIDPKSLKEQEQDSIPSY